MKNLGPVLILGARSDIARAIAHRYASAGFDLVLAARGAAGLASDVEDLKLRYRVAVHAVEFDVTDLPAAFLDREAGQTYGTIICVVGAMGDQARSEQDPEAATDVMITNYVGPARLLDALITRMVPSGTLIGISSVAGDRGRATNYVYGSAKAGFSAYLSGLRNRLAKTGLHVITVKPGFVHTRMTVGMKLPKRLTADPSEIAEAIYQAQSKGSNIVYSRPIWRLLMTIICAIPEGIFKRMKI